nr:DUF2172 domain-containing protein [Nocardioides ungokensis]
MRRTLDLVGEALPAPLVLERRAVPSGTAAYDWTVNDEWNVRDAWIADANGRRVVDFQEHNLHLVSYSVPVRARMSMDELRPHPPHPARAPGLDPVPDDVLQAHVGFLPDPAAARCDGGGPFEVVVDTTLEPGELTYASS